MSDVKHVVISAPPAPKELKSSGDGWRDPNSDAPQFPIEAQQPSTNYHGGSGKSVPPSKPDDFEDHYKKGFMARPGKPEDTQASNMTPRAHPKTPGA